MKEKTAQILLKKVENDYSVIAEEFDQTRSYVGKEFGAFDKLLIPNAQIIDLGCGNGRIIEHLNDFYRNSLNSGFSYTGIDNSESLLESAKNKYKMAHVHFIHGNQLKIPAKDSSVDLLFNIRAFHHIPSKKLRLKSLKEMHRILKNDGVLVLTVWNLYQKKYIKYVFKSLLRFLYTMGKFAPNDTLIPFNHKVNRYYHAFLPFELKHLLNQAGFRIEELSKNRDIVVIARKK